MVMKAFSLLLVFLLLPLTAQAMGKKPKDPKMTHECQAVQDERSYKYCISRREGSRNNDVLYFFHGSGHTEKRWKDGNYTQAIQQIWRESKFDPPTVIAVSFGRQFILRGQSDQSDDSYGGLLDRVVYRIMPRLETHIGGLKGRRILVGTSMGGFNAYQLYFKHPQLWEKASIQCPIATTIHPWASSGEIDQYIEENPGTSRLAVNQMLLLSRRFYPDQEAFQKDNPLLLARSFAPHLPPLYLSCGDKDYYGFFGGNQIIADMAKKLGAPMEWQAIKEGSHCAIDVNHMASFIAGKKLPQPKKLRRYYRI